MILNCNCPINSKGSPDVEIEIETIPEPEPSRFKIICASHETRFCKRLEEEILNGYYPISDLKVSVPFEGDSNYFGGHPHYSMLLEKEETITIPSISDEGISIHLTDLYNKLDSYLLDCELAKKKPSAKAIIKCILKNEVDEYE